MNKLAKTAFKYSKGELTKEEIDKYFELYFKLREKEDNKFYNKMSHEKRVKIHKKLVNIYRFKNKFLDNSIYEIIKPREKQNKDALRYTMILEDDSIISLKIKDGEESYIASVLKINGINYVNLKQKTIDNELFSIESIKYQDKEKKVNTKISLTKKDDMIDFTQDKDNIKIKKIRKRSLIFAPTHICKSDVEILGEVLNEHFYVFVGDFEHLQGTPSGFVLGLMGVEYVAENVKSDRIAAANRMVIRMGDGGNLYLCPEGTWNLDPALLALHIYWGFVKIAKMTNALVEPIAIERYTEIIKGKEKFKYYISFDEYIDPMLYGDKNEDLIKVTTDYRTSVATLKYDIFNYRGVFKRSELDIKEWDNEVLKRVSEWYNYSKEYNDSFMFKPKGIVREEDVMKDTIEAILDLPHNQKDYTEPQKIKD